MAIQIRLDILTREARFCLRDQFFRKNYVWLTDELRSLKENVKRKLPNNFFEKILDPFHTFMIKLGSKKFDRIFEIDNQTPLEDLKLTVEQVQYYRETIPEIMDALLQRGHQFFEGGSEIFTKDLNAFQVLVTDLYESLNSKKLEDIVPPLVRWAPQSTPHTFPVFGREGLEKIKVGIVSLPIGNRSGGLITWGTLGHEVAGHNFLQNVPELLKDLKVEMVRSVEKTYKDKRIGDLTNEMRVFWKSCTEEVSCDILGVLSLGPMGVMCSLAFLRSLRRNEKLSNIAEQKRTTHPPDILRIIMMQYIMNNCLRGMDSEMKKWDKLLKKEIKKDEPNNRNVIFLTFEDNDGERENGSFPVPLEVAKKVGINAAHSLATTKIKSLKGKLIDIINWKDEDFGFSSQSKRKINEGSLLLKPSLHTYSGRHIIAGAVMAALETDVSIEDCFKQMKDYLALKFTTTPFLGQKPYS